MADPQITPHRITKPIQLLAAWLAGLAIVNASFLTAAATIHAPTWVPGFLVIAAVLNVPLFLISLFLLQTKFRPQMQEDSYYSKYLEKTYSDTPRSATPLNVEKPLRELAEKIVAEVAKAATVGEQGQEEKVVALLRDSGIDYLADKFSSSRTLSELYMYPNLWTELVKSWGKDEAFIADLTALVDAGLIELPDQNVERAKFSSMGKAVASRLETKGKLWNQNNTRHMEHTKKNID
jgi:hypothetical protein